MRIKDIVSGEWKDTSVLIQEAQEKEVKPSHHL